MSKLVDFEAVLLFIDQSINPTYLNPTQEIVLREVWNGKTYSEMACQHNYDPEYIKSVGCSLWQTLSHTFNNQINKSNFVPFMRQRINQLLEEQESSSVVYKTKPLINTVKNYQKYHWTTAPNIKIFEGRKEEIETLNSWSQNLDCRCIIVSGMVGCGKTTLATEFAKSVIEQFDNIIWFSLHQTPSLAVLLHNYLKLLNYELNTPVNSKDLDLSFLLSEFIDCLRRNKILLVLDNLQSIFEVNRTNVLYKKEFEEYSQFLRTLITANHQSILLATSRIKPTMLEYYTKNQIKFLDLQGLKSETTEKLFTKLSSLLDAPKLLFIAENLRYNPQLLKIVNNYINDFSEDSIEQIIQDVSLIEEISDLLELELSYLSDLDKEIVYWLAISCSPISLKQLIWHTEQSQRKLKFSQRVSYLTKRSLIIQENSTYSLMPIMKVYLRRKLVKQAL